MLFRSIVLLTLPVVGFLLYAFWSGSFQRKRIARQHPDNTAEPESVRMRSEMSADKLNRQLPNWSRLSSYLHHRADFKPGMFVDLQNEVGRLGIQDQSLQKLYANLFHEKISKRQRLTNWEADALTNRQCLYAATDAWTCIRLYEEICRLAETGDYELVTVEEPAPKQERKPINTEA